MVDDNGELMRTPEEDELQLRINSLKQNYQREYTELKDLKTEIERIQNLLERCRVRMQKDFEQWLEVMIKHQQQQVASGGGGGRQPQQPMAAAAQNSRGMAMMQAQQQQQQ